MIKVNDKVHSINDRVQWEFGCIKDYLIGKGVDVGCGTNRLSEDVFAIDQQPDQKFAHTDLIHDCKDLEVGKSIEWKGKVYHFNDNEFDFIFSSHCLEDFENIPEVFKNWWKKLRANGVMLLLLPDMESCNCKLCMLSESIARRKIEGRSARYWTIEDLSKNHKGNPSHRTNVGKVYMNNMLENAGVEYKILQCDTLPHNKTCTIDFVIKKIC